MTKRHSPPPSPVVSWWPGLFPECSRSLISNTRPESRVLPPPSPHCPPMTSPLHQCLCPPSPLPCSPALHSTPTPSAAQAPPLGLQPVLPEPTMNVQGTPLPPGTYTAVVAGHRQQSSRPGVQPGTQTAPWRSAPQRGSPGEDPKTAWLLERGDTWLAMSLPDRSAAPLLTARHRVDMWAVGGGLWSAASPGQQHVGAWASPVLTTPVSLFCGGSKGPT